MSLADRSLKIQECEHHIEKMKSRLLEGVDILNQLTPNIQRSSNDELSNTLRSVEGFLETLICCSKSLRALTSEVDQYRKALNLIDFPSQPPAGRA